MLKYKSKNSSRHKNTMSQSILTEKRFCDYIYITSFFITTLDFSNYAFIKNVFDFFKKLMLFIVKYNIVTYKAFC